jgi:hypothetical protein
MFQEPGSTVKHVKWTWPDCLVGDGSQQQQGLGESETDRGVYNVTSPCTPSPHLSRLTVGALRSLSASLSASTAPTTTPSSTCPSRSPTASPPATTGRRATR